ncbi:T9SS type A sorting domain-containing protein [Prolixibacteraceae bacterium]|nr:T9SS type A sorting domain-containing protein [Prolixibacteraceae bacterium]
MKKSLCYGYSRLLLKVSILLVLLGSFSMQLLAQSHSGSHPVQVEQLETSNDYQIKYRMILSSPFPECGGVKWKENRPVIVKDGSYYDIGGTIENWSIRTVTVDAYPGGTLRLGGTFISRSTLLNCEQWSRGARYLTAAPLKQPYNFNLLYEESQKRVILRWSNATYVPTDKYKIKVKRTDLADNTVTIVELNGGTESYTDTRNMRPGARFKYEVATYFPGGYSTNLFLDCPSRTSPWVRKEITLDNVIENLEVDTRKTSVMLKWDVNSTTYHDALRFEYLTESGSWNLVEELSATTNMYDWVPSFSLVPGDIYQIRVRAMKDLDEIQSLNSSGYISPNGVLSGHVRIADSEKGVPNVPLKIVSSNIRGVKYQVFNIANLITSTNEETIARNLFTEYTPVSSGTIDYIHLGMSHTSWNFGVLYDTWVYFPEDGDYTIYLGNIDDGGVLKINGVERMGMDLYDAEEHYTQYYNAGFQHIEFAYVNNTGSFGFSLKYSGPGISKRNFPADVLHIAPGDVKYTETDSEGYFYVDEIYYGEESSFDVTCMKEDADIQPHTISRTLSLNDHKQDNILFQDHSSIPVYGVVKVEDCPVAEAQVMFNGEKESTVTKEDGTFEYIIQSPDPSLPNTLGVFYKDHEFDMTVDLNLIEDTENKDNPIVFHDMQTDSLDLSVFSGCGEPIADEVDVVISRTDGSGNICYSETYTLDATGQKYLELPATYYQVKVVDLRITNTDATETMINDFNDVKENIISSFPEMNIDLTQRDTIKVQEKTVINDKTGETKITEKVTDIKLVTSHFRYRQKIELDLQASAFETVAGSHQVEFEGETFNEDIYTIEQGTTYPVKIKLNEKYDYYPIMSHQCGVEEAKLTIVDNISDRNAVERTIVDGTYEYSALAGSSNINGPWNKPRGYQKNLSVTAVIEDYKDNPFVEQWAMVLGHKILEPTFITNQLSLPEFILHDPPGDESYAFIEKGLSLTTGTVYHGANLNGVDFHSLFSFAIPTPVMNLGFGASVDVSHKEGWITDNEDIHTTTFSESITTTTDLTGTGEDADVIIGSGINFVYSKSKLLEYDNINEPTIDESFAVSPGFKTRYVVSIFHVRTKVIPALNAILEEVSTIEDKLANGTAVSQEDQYLFTQKDIFSESLNNWLKLLADNKRTIFMGGDPLSENESSISNLTFSGGNNYDYSSDESTTTTRNVGYHWEVNTKVNTSFVGVNPLMDLARIELGLAYVNDSSTDETKINTTVSNLKQGFHLGDSSAGDYFTLNVTKDPTYGTYLFHTVSGTSSCPNEPNTQARDRVKMTVVSEPILSNLPKGKSAVFRVRLDNDSQSEEGRIYSINSLTGQETGATIKVGGKKIFGLGNRYSVYIPADETVDLTVEVIPGPETKSLPVELVATPDCMTNVYITEDIRASIDDELKKVPADVSKITLQMSWESNCDPIQIESPADNFVVNTYADNSLPVTLTGFDPNSTELEYIELEYRKAGTQEWSTLKQLSGAAIGEFPKKHLTIRMDTMSAGKYYLRANSYCQNLNVRNYSNVVQGVVDHSEFVVTGTNLEDGWLREPQFVVEFSKALSQARFKVERLNSAKTEIYSTDYVDAVVQGYNALVTIPSADLYEGFTYRITALSGETNDMNGELLQTDKSFDMVLDRSSVKWKQNNQVIIVLQGETTEVTSSLMNSSAKEIPFKVVANTLSGFITPKVPSGVLPGNGTFPLVFEVNPYDNLATGRFDGVVTVLIEEDGVSYTKDLQVELIVKANKPSVSQPEAKAYQMHVVAQFTTSSSANIPLSDDGQDFIAAYIGGEVAGFSPLTYDAVSGEYRSYITVEADANSSQSVTYKMWDDSQNIMYVASESDPFADDRLIGTANNPKILHASKAEQYITLHSGWNFISFNVSPTNSAVNSVMASITQDGAQIKHIYDGFSAYSSTAKSWSGALTTIDEKLGYKVYVDQADILKVKGDIINEAYALYASEYSNQKYNWVAVHSVEAANIQTAVNRVPLAANVVLRHNDAFSVLREDKSSWSGSVNFVEPGKGYELYDPNQLSDVVETVSTVQTKSATMDLSPIVEANVRNTMTFIGQSYLNGQLLNSDDYTVEAMLEGDVIARNFISVNDLLTREYQFYLLKAKEGSLEDISFRLTDKLTGKSYTAKQSVNFENDKIVGTLSSPFKLEFGEALESGTDKMMKVYPNPVKSGEICNVHMTRDFNGSVILEVTDVVGRVVMQKEVTTSRFTINTSSLKSGVYHITARKGSTVYGIEKFIVF